jgi:hypothetical protein
VKALEQMTQLARIDELIRDRSFVATQSAIALKLGCTDRQIRNFFDVLSKLGAPLVVYGAWRNGWVYDDAEWDFWVAVKEYCKETNT